MEQMLKDITEYINATSFPYILTERDTMIALITAAVLVVGIIVFAIFFRRYRKRKKILRIIADLKDIENISTDIEEIIEKTTNGKKKGKPDVSQLSAKEKDKLRLAADNNKQKRKGKIKIAKVAEEKRKVPKTAQDTLPYRRVVDDYIIELEKDRYSVTYRFSDINYEISSHEEQEKIFLDYVKILNSFDSTVDIQITVHNNKINEDDFKKSVLSGYKNRGDGYDLYRAEFRDMLINKVKLGQNGLERRLYISVSFVAIDVETARNKFHTIDSELRSSFKVLGSHLEKLTSNERIVILKDIYRGVDINIKEFEQYEFERGTDKAFCTPDYFEFKKDYFMYNDKYARVLFIKDLPNSLRDTIVKDLTDVNFSMIYSINMVSIDPSDAIKKTQHIITNIKGEKNKYVKKAAKSGVFDNACPEAIENSLAEAQELLQDLVSRNQKMFQVNFLLMLIADSFDELDKQQTVISQILGKHVCRAAINTFQQEDAMASVVPLGNSRIKLRRTLTSESAAVNLPFKAMELRMPGGMYYGLNELSNNMILINKKQMKNSNQFILGTPGSGKSFAAKMEIYNTFLTGDADILIVDPEREYTPLTESLNGEVVKISNTSPNYINPFDMSKNYNTEGEPYDYKANFILSFAEALIASKVNRPLTAAESTIIDRCAKLAYERKGYPNVEKGIPDTYNEDNPPTLVDFYEILCEQPEPIVQDLKLSFEIYAVGTNKLFRNMTNVNIENRVICYDIKDLGENLKVPGMLVVLDYIWNRICKNRELGKNTYVILDEIYLLFKSRASAEFLEAIWKRARKYGGIPIGITQNVNDLLKSPTASTMLSNTDNILMLNQATTDLDELQRVLKLSDSVAAYCHERPAGCGLIYLSGVCTIPFVNDFPKDTLCYNIMSTKFGEKITEETV